MMANLEHCYGSVCTSSVSGEFGQETGALNLTIKDFYDKLGLNLTTGWLFFPPL